MAFSTTQRIPIPDVPRFVDPAGAAIGNDALGFCTQIADAANYLNFYARAAFPYTRVRANMDFGGVPVGVSTTRFFHRASAPDYAGRELAVIVGVKAHLTLTASTSVTVAVEHVDSSTTRTRNASSDALVPYESDTIADDYDVSHVVIKMPLTGDAWNEYAITLTGCWLDGWGAWELPSRDGGEGGASMAAAGIQPQTASVLSSVDFAVSLSELVPGRVALAATAQDICSAVENAFDNNRTCLFSAGHELSTVTTMGLHTDSPNNTGSWVAVPTGGIPIVPGPRRNGLHSADTDRSIRVYIHYHNGVAGNASWRIVDGAGTTSSTETLTANTTAWTYNQMQIRSESTLDTLQIELREDSSGSNPAIYAIQIWEYAPPA